MIKKIILLFSILVSINIYAINAVDLLDNQGNPQYDVNNASDREIIITSTVNSGDVIDAKIINMKIQALKLKIQEKE